MEGNRCKMRGRKERGGMSYIYTNLFQIIVKPTEEHVIIL